MTYDSYSRISPCVIVSCSTSPHTSVAFGKLDSLALQLSTSKVRYLAAIYNAFIRVEVAITSAYRTSAGGRRPMSLRYLCRSVVMDAAG